MSKTLRSVIFFTFLIAFLVSAPLVVLYTAGYRLDLTHGRIVHTSVLNLTSLPRSATVLVDGKSYSDRTPSVIDTILPGEHLVRLELDEYLSWEHTFEFESSVARVVGPITLFADTQTTILDTLHPATSAVNPDRSALAYATQESSWLEVWHTDDPRESTSLLMRLPFAEDSAYEIEWSPGGTYLLLAKSEGAQSELHVAHVEGGTIGLPDGLEAVDAYWWNIGLEDELIVRVEDQLTRYNLATGTREDIAYQADFVRSWGNQDVTLLESNNRTVLSFQEDETASIITYLTLGDYRFVPAPEGLIGLHDARRNRLVLLDAQNLDQPILLNEEVSLWEWDSTGEHLLYSTGFDLKHYHRSTHESETLTRLSHTVDALHWYPLGAVAMYQSNGTTTALQLSGREVLSSVDLVSEASGAFWFAKQVEDLFILIETEDGASLLHKTLQK
jgi:hypothetical protein